MQDFMKVESVSFPKSGGHTTPKHSFSDFTFRYLQGTGTSCKLDSWLLVAGFEKRDSDLIFFCKYENFPSEFCLARYPCATYSVFFVWGQMYLSI